MMEGLVSVPEVIQLPTGAKYNVVPVSNGQLLVMPIQNDPPDLLSYQVRPIIGPINYMICSCDVWLTNGFAYISVRLVSFCLFRCILHNQFFLISHLTWSIPI